MEHDCSWMNLWVDIGSPKENVLGGNLQTSVTLPAVAHQETTSWVGMVLVTLRHTDTHTHLIKLGLNYNHLQVKEKKGLQACKLQWTHSGATFIFLNVSNVSTFRSQWYGTFFFLEMTLQLWVFINTKPSMCQTRPDVWLQTHVTHHSKQIINGKVFFLSSCASYVMQASKLMAFVVATWNFLSLSYEKVCQSESKHLQGMKMHRWKK